MNCVLCSDGGVEWKAPMRALPCLAPSGVHSVQPLASKTRQPIAYSSFHPKPPSTFTEISSKLWKFRGSRGVYVGLSLRLLQAVLSSSLG